MQYQSTVTHLDQFPTNIKSFERQIFKARIQAFLNNSLKNENEKKYKKKFILFPINEEVMEPNPD